MVKIAILGFGTVGSGVAEVIMKNANTIAANAADKIEVKYILDLREFPDSPFADRVIHDFSVIENDPEVQVVVETMGGLKPAYDFTRRCLMRGKHVVTSNKEMVAQYGAELLALAHEKNLNYLFEASVGGGIPIIRPLSQCLAANELVEICGILNGTTNYILTRMIKSKLSFDQALSEAQEKGYAERDPSADVDGHDACRKMCILSSLAFGRHIYPSQVETRGIRDVTLSDVAYARSGGMVLKLLGRSRKLSDGKVGIFVSPHLVDTECPLASVEDVFNGIMVRGNAIGDVMFYGRGAGKLPTASAVVADVIDAAKHFKARKYLDWREGGDDVVGQYRELVTKLYLRAEGGEALRARAQVLFPGLTMLSSEGDARDEFAFVTAQMDWKALDEAAKTFAQEAHVLMEMPVLA